MSLLTINAGSSSLKLALYETETLRRTRALFVERIGAAGSRLLIDGTAERRIEAKDHAGALEQIVRDLPELFASGLRAIGHRLVHGGIEHAQPELITAGLLKELHALEHLDPTHMPQALAVIEAVVRHFPDVPQFACFDTAFHRSMPTVAQRYPLPRWTADAGVRRYGFHGLSCESIISQLEQIDGRAAKGRLFIAHLGNGASITAVHAGRSVDTSMGFSPTSGLMMGTRSGDLDPTVMTYLARTRAMNTDALERLVNQEAGLLGVSGTGHDMRDLLERARTDETAAGALELYCYLARKQFGALAAVLGGVETIVFTGGVGEHAAHVREKICRGLEYLGLQLDVNHNDGHEAIISARDSRVVVRVMTTDEDLIIARHVVALLKERSR
jgi:acetate kinase